MPSAYMDSLIHPIRLQILWAVAGRDLTPQQIGTLLPDISQATLYRHLQKLVQIGVLEVVRETPIRGTVEKVYHLVEHKANISRDEFANANREDHIRYLSTFITSMIPLYRAYVMSEMPETIAQDVSYRSGSFFADEEQRIVFREKFQQLMLETSRLPKTENQRRIFFSYLLFPESSFLSKKSGLW